MSKLKIIVAPDARLLKVSNPVAQVNKEIQGLLNEMLEIMYKSNGIGLAAPQVGVLSRLVVMDCSDKNNKRKAYKFVNPEVLSESPDTSEFEEGCLSLPTQFAKVTRPSTVEIKYQNESGKSIKDKFSGIEATCLQHEIDHLNGKLFVDHISKLKRNRIIKKLEKYKKQNNLKS